MIGLHFDYAIIIVPLSITTLFNAAGEPIMRRSGRLCDRTVSWWAEISETGEGREQKAGVPAMPEGDGILLAIL